MFILYLCITIVLALFMVYMMLWYKQKKDLSSITSETDGNIVKVVKQDYNDPNSGEDKTACTLKAVYSVGGRQYKTSMRTNEESESYQEGQSVTVMYDKNNPRHSYIKGDKQPQLVWRTYMISSVILFIIFLIVFIITMPLTLGISSVQKEQFDKVMHIVLFLFGLAGLIIYPRTKEYKNRRKNGISTKKEIGALILIIGETGFELIWDIIEILIKH